LCLPGHVSDIISSKRFAFCQSLEAARTMSSQQKNRETKIFILQCACTFSHPDNKNAVQDGNRVRSNSASGGLPQNNQRASKHTSLWVAFVL